ncbi:hypothetical protein B0H10DRAFT_2370718, partial [Mycena sp. CBHHK59/15]
VLEKEALLGIQSLPSELICVISSLSCTDPKPRALSPVHTLARVCMLWRNIAHGLPDLWTDIRLFSCHPDPVPCPWISLDVPFTVAGKELVEFWAVVLKIWSVAPRWRRLSIINTNDNFSRMQNNVGRKTAPCLESLQLRVIQSESLTHRRPVLSLGSIPALKSLVPHGISLVIFSILDQLENLDLFGTNAALVMEFAAQFAAFSRNPHAIPRLRHLSLRGRLPRLHGTSGAALKTYISSLTTLTLGNVRRDDSHFQSLCCLLSTPLLEELSLTDLTHTCWDTLTRSLSDERLEFPILRTLKLSSIAQCTLHGYFATAFLALEHLSLLHVDCSTFLSALSTRQSVLGPIYAPWR